MKRKQILSIILSIGMAASVAGGVPVMAADQQNNSASEAESNQQSNSNDISDATVADIPDVTYTGKAQKPAVKVTFDNKELKADTDYTLIYSDNTDVGEAEITIIGIGNYSGGYTTSFNIKPADLKGGRIAVSKSGKSDNVTVTDKDGNTVDASNYDVKTVLNKDGKNATITVTGKKNYTGELTETVAAENTGSETKSDARSNTKNDATPVKLQKMYRVYNPNSSEHFYTASYGEKKHLVSIGWQDEGVGWYAPLEGTAIYRLYNPNAGDHFYTTSAGERLHLISSGWQDEGIGWYAASKTDKDAVPVYRQYNPNARKAGSHNYTTSEAEREHLVKLGWKDEKIAWYGYKR